MWLRKLSSDNIMNPKYTQLCIFKIWKEGDWTQRRKQGNHRGRLELCDHKPKNANKPRGPGRAWNGGWLWGPLGREDASPAALMLDFLPPRGSLPERCGHTVRVCNPSCLGARGSQITNSAHFRWQWDFISTTNNNNKPPNSGNIIQCKVLASSVQGPRLESQQSTFST